MSRKLYYYKDVRLKKVYLIKLIMVSVSHQKHIVDCLNTHKDAFDKSIKFSELTGQPTPQDTAKWSQIFVSILISVKGLYQKKGPDLSDGSDVKGACVWKAIDTPRFNGVVPAGRILTKYKSSSNIYKKIYFVLWDYNLKKKERCRVWGVNIERDNIFREMVDKWYKQREDGIIKSSNFQLHPPRNKDGNILRNKCGNLEYPLIFEAVFENKTYVIKKKSLDILENEKCKIVNI